MVMKMDADNKSSKRTSSVIERWLRHGDLGVTNHQPHQNGVAPLARGSASSSSTGLANFSDESSSPKNRSLSESFRRMSIGGGERTETRRVFEKGGHGFGFGFGLGLDHETPPQALNGFDGDSRSVWMGLGSRDSIGSPLTHTTRSSRNSSPTFVNENGQMSFYSGEFQNQIGGPYVSDVPVWSHPNEHCFNGGEYGLGLGGTFGSQDLLLQQQQQQHNLGVNVNRSVIRERTRVNNNNNNNNNNNPSPVLGYNQSVLEYEGFNCEDSFILEPSPEINKRRSDRNGSLIGAADDGWTEIDYFQKRVLENFRAMAAQEGFVYLMAKDQSGCRNLQKVFEEGTREDVNMIFENVIDHVVELSMDPFGNYLVQKLLEVCVEGQRRQIIFAMTKEPGELLWVSLNTHGTRVVQKLIETARNWRSISLLMRALEPGILDLIKDLNGNHVLQSCLKCLSNEDNAFIFNAATRFCIDISTHRHGCCVMQKCIERSTGFYQLRLVTEILKHAVFLAADPYGNYVIQFIIEQKIHYAINQMTACFKGHYVLLSTQKCGSHVVEKCLKELPQTREDIVAELLKASHFEQLLQDPFANYVIQSALKHTKGNPYNALVHRVRSHNHSLRASPYCKKILSQAMPKK